MSLTPPLDRYMASVLQAHTRMLTVLVLTVLMLTVKLAVQLDARHVLMVIMSIMGIVSLVLVLV